MSEKKWNCGETVVNFFFPFFCLSAFLFFFNSSFRVFCSFFPLISHRIVPNDEQQTNKQKNPIISASIAQSQRGFWGWNGELSSKHLDEHRGGGGGRRSIKFMRGESSKSSRRQRMAAQLTVRKHSLHHTARGGACVGVRGLDVKQQQQQKKTSLENGVFESFPLRKIKWSKSEREKGRGIKGKQVRG